jgi:NAD-dependent deacetylase
MRELIATVTRWVDDAKRIVVLSGAGISTDSGIPDFRGPQGVWTMNPEAEKMSNISYYVADKEVRKKAWRYRMENRMWEREPNPGHLSCLRLEQREKLLMVITQNVDGLHLKAGTSPGRLVEIHGTVREVVCLDCGERAPIERALKRVETGEDDPPCRSCGGILKTATISFGQALVQRDIERAQLAARNCDLLIAVGSTLSVYPVAGVVPTAKECGAKLVIINAERTAMDSLADAILRGSISEIFPQIVRA